MSALYYKVPIENDRAIESCSHCSPDFNRDPTGSFCIMKCGCDHFPANPAVEVLTEQQAKDLIASWPNPLAEAMP